ncbi:hypothetical protein NDU88_002077 [Pleurodeles waltl]|uniref:EF-hand domain-containing protein n=1 Tax=Pleurodeles waltl TaxID=8319 RepID=A0AAV7W163_PLEWA|nr:hypothetical protein NDU88_002077 [Pleurodeles waltl]
MEGESDVSRLRALFLSCDANCSGRLEREDIDSLCAELRVSPEEAEAVFQRLDTDHDGAITFQEFTMGFHGTRGSPWLRRGGSGADVRAPSEPEDELQHGEDPFNLAWEDFQLRLGEEATFIPRHEQVSVLYQNINIVEPRLIQQYERVIRNFIREIKLQSTEMENLAFAVKRAQDKAAMQLSELEEEMEQRIQAAEHKIRTEEKRKAEDSLTDLKRQHESEVADLQVTIKKLKKLEEQSKSLNLKEDVASLKKRLHDLTMENQKLRKDLLESQTSIAFLQSELDALKSDFADQSLSSERDLEIIHEYTEERENLARQIEMLKTANRKLHDSNDGLRMALENGSMKNNKSLHVGNGSPGNTISRNSPRFNESQNLQIPLYEGRSPRSSYMDEDYDSLAICDPMQRMNYEVDSLPESCIDSGLSTLRDSNEYDSEAEYKPPRNHRRSQFRNESFGGDASDTDVPEIRDEESDGLDGSTLLDWKPSQPVSRSSSGASTRKCISALSPQENITDRDHKSKPAKAYKIVLAGDAAVGKSSFLTRLCKNEFRGNTSATLGVDFHMKTLVVDGEPTILQLWDTAGQERFRSIAKSYFRRADGVLLLYDVSCEKSFLNVREWVDMISEVTQDNVPIMMVGNKADLRQVGAEQGPKCVPTSYGEKLAMTYNALFCETSAKEGSNVVEAVLHLARDVKKRCDRDEHRESVTNLSGTPSKKSSQMKNCCTS